MAASIHNMETNIEPAYCRLKTEIDDSMKEKLRRTASSLQGLLHCKKLHEMLIRESKLLHISIYKRSAQLRIEKSLQLLKRVKACLQRLHLFDRLFALIQDINQDISKPLSSEKSEVFLPSQQVWTYSLHLILNYFHLLGKTIEYCITTFEHLSCHFTSGMLIPVMVFYMGIVARIWQICRSLQTRFVKFYPTVYSIHLKVKPSASDWVYPSLPLTLPIPCTQTASQVEEWSIVNSSNSMVEGGNKLKEESLDDEEILQTIESINDDTEDIGVAIVSNSKKRKGERADDKIFVSKKSKLSPQIRGHAERPTHKTEEASTNPNLDSDESLRKKRMKKKQDSQKDISSISVSDQTFNKSDRDNKEDDFELLKKKLMKKNKKKKTVKKELMSNSAKDLTKSAINPQDDLIQKKQLKRKTKKKKRKSTGPSPVKKGLIDGNHVSEDIAVVEPKKKKIKLMKSSKKKKKNGQQPDYKQEVHQTQDSKEACLTDKSLQIKKKKKKI